MALVQWNGLWMWEKDRGTEFNMSFQVGQVGQLDTRGRMSRMHRCSRYFWERDIFQDESASEVWVSFGISTLQKHFSFHKIHSALSSTCSSRNIAPAHELTATNGSDDDGVSSTFTNWGWMVLHLKSSQPYKCWHAGTTFLFFLSNSYIPFFKQLLHGTSLCGFLLLSWGG